MTAEILKALNADKEAPWADWTNGIQKGLTSHRLAKVLREHFQVKSARPGQAATSPRGYWLEDLEPYFNMLQPEDSPSSGGVIARPSEPARSTIQKQADRILQNRPPLVE